MINIKTIIIVTQDPVQPLCNPVNVSEADILEQENKGFFLIKSSNTHQICKVHLAQRALARAMKLYETQQRERRNGVMMMTS